jgi:hypothetical protein
VLCDQSPQSLSSVVHQRYRISVFPIMSSVCRARGTIVLRRCCHCEGARGSVSQKSDIEGSIIRRSDGLFVIDRSSLIATIEEQHQGQGGRERGMSDDAGVSPRL